MSDHAPRGDEGDGSDEPDDGPELRTRPRVADAIAETDAYETDGGVVLYDVEEPLAWIEADSAVDLGDAV